MATRKPRASKAQQPAPAATQPTTEVQATEVQATEVQATEVQPAPTLATPLPANFVATAPTAAASLQAFATFKLPNSLQAKGAGLCGGNLPPKLAAPGALLVLGPAAGKANPRSLHNAAWWQSCQQALAAGPLHATELAKQAGVGYHSISAYLQRGWLALQAAQQ